MHFRVGLLVAAPDSSGEELLDGIVDYVRQHPHWRVQHSDWWQPRRPSDFDGFDGLIVRQPLNVVPKAVRKRSIPIVDLSSHRPPLPGIPRVTVDNHAVGRIAAEHFLHRGYRNLAFFGRQVPVYSCQRLRGFQETGEAAGARVFKYAHPEVHGWARRSLLVSVQRWLRRLPRPLAVMAECDMAARTVMEACQPDIAVPEEVAILSVDNNPRICELCNPALSSISLDLRRVGYRAAVLLDELMGGAPPPAEPIVVPPGDVFLRRSSDILAIEDAAVARAVRYIEDRAGERITLCDICDHVLVPKRSLELRFRKALARSPREEIRHARLRIARRLLAGPMSIAAVAAKSGFSDQSRFGRIFKQHCGLTPIAYRRSLHDGRAG